MKSTRIQQMVITLGITLLCLTLTAGLAFAQAHGHSSSSSSSSCSGGESSQSAKQAKKANTASKKAVRKATEKIKAAGGGEQVRVELKTPGTAVTALPGQVPTSKAGVSTQDKARLEHVTVNRQAPIPTKLK